MPTDFISSLGQAFLARRLLRLSDAFVDDIEAYLRQAGLTAPARAFSTLLLLYRVPDLTIIQVARQLGTPYEIAVDVLSELERRRLVTFRHDEADRRRRVISLTDEGQAEAAKINDALPVVQAAYAEVSREAGVDMWDVANRLDDTLARRSFLQRLADIKPPSD